MSLLRGGSFAAALLWASMASGEDLVPLQARHIGTERCEDRRLVTRTGPQLKDPLAWRGSEQLRHPRHDPRLADGLTGRDRHRLVGVRAPALIVIEEQFPRHAGHGFEHAFVADATGPELLLDHAPSIVVSAHARESRPGPAGSKVRKR